MDPSRKWRVVGGAAGVSLVVAGGATAVASDAGTNSPDVLLDDIVPIQQITTSTTLDLDETIFVVEDATDSLSSPFDDDATAEPGDDDEASIEDSIESFASPDSPDSPDTVDSTDSVASDDSVDSPDSAESPEESVDSPDDSADEDEESVDSPDDSSDSTDASEGD